MLDSGRVVVRIDVRLREIEARQIILGKALPQRQRLGDSVVTHAVLLR
jgi:hypothetical protein